MLTNNNKSLSKALGEAEKVIVQRDSSLASAEVIIVQRDSTLTSKENAMQVRDHFIRRALAVCEPPVCFSLADNLVTYRKL